MTDALKLGSFLSFRPRWQNRKAIGKWKNAEKYSGKLYLFTYALGAGMVSWYDGLTIKLSFFPNTCCQSKTFVDCRDRIHADGYIVHIIVYKAQFTLLYIQGEIAMSLRLLFFCIFFRLIFNLSQVSCKFSCSAYIYQYGFQNTYIAYTATAISLMLSWVEAGDSFIRCIREVSLRYQIFVLLSLF